MPDIGKSKTETRRLYNRLKQLVSAPVRYNPYKPFSKTAVYIEEHGNELNPRDNRRPFLYDPDSGILHLGQWGTYHDDIWSRLPGRNTWLWYQGYWADPRRPSPSLEMPTDYWADEPGVSWYDTEQKVPAETKAAIENALWAHHGEPRPQNDWTFSAVSPVLQPGNDEDGERVKNCGVDDQLAYGDYGQADHHSRSNEQEEDVHRHKYINSPSPVLQARNKRDAKRNGSSRYGDTSVHGKWTPGQNGKALVSENGEVVSWNVDAFGSPHHAEVVQDLGWTRRVLNYVEIHPDGEYDYWGNISGDTSAPDQALERHHPQLHRENEWRFGKAMTWTPSQDGMHRTAAIPTFEEPNDAYGQVIQQPIEPARIRRMGDSIGAHFLLYPL